MKLAMEPSEILVRYKQAKNKNKQVEILAQLNACSRGTIEDIIKENGSPADLAGLKPKPKKCPAHVWTPDEDRLLDELSAEHRPHVDIADRLGVSVTQIRNRLYRRKCVEAEQAREQADHEPSTSESFTPEPESQEPDGGAGLHNEKPRIPLYFDDAITNLEEAINALLTLGAHGHIRCAALIGAAIGELRIMKDLRL